MRTWKVKLEYVPEAMVGSEVFLPFPKELVDECQLADGDVVEVSFDDKNVHIKIPVYNLELRKQYLEKKGK